MNSVRIGILGFGNMGTIHADNIYNGKIPNLQLSAICDFNIQRQERAKSLYKDVKIFSDGEEMIKSGLIDALLVAVPHYDHPKYAMLGFENNLHVLIEKPAGVHTKQVKMMNEASKKTNKVFAIMYNQRTNPCYQKIKDLVESGSLGHIKRITWIITTWYRPQAYHDSSTWRSTWKDEGGGTLINQNPHQLDLWQWMFGMPDEIYSDVSYGKFYDIEVEDEVVALFKYKNGTIGQYITSTGEFPGSNRLEISCDMGKIVVEGNDDKLIFYKNVISEREHNKINKSPFGLPENWKCEIPIDTSKGEQHIGILKNFTNAILKNEKLLSPGIEGINGLTISNAIHLSSWKNEAVKLENFPDDEFYDMLQDKIKNSKVVKKESNVVVDIHGTH